MGALTGAVHWWEESQLRVLVLTSLVIQSFLFFFPCLRRKAIPGWFRFIMWLAYHGGDAVAIYALATLFNRHKVNEGDGGVGRGSGSTLLEVVWAPVLLIHLGGSDGVTAYNIEDNELWTRHLLTAVSQVTVAVYVFCKSWPQGGDKRLLAAAILLFVVGVGECFYKALAFKRASIYSLVSSGASAKQINGGNMFNTGKLEEYVKNAKDTVNQQQSALISSKDEAAEGSMNHPRSPIREIQEARNNNPTGTQQGRPFEERGGWMDGLCLPEGLLSSKAPERRRQQTRQEARKEERLIQERGEVSKLFVDLSSPYPLRISIFKNFWGHRDEERAYGFVRGRLATAFLLLYTKSKTSYPSKSNGTGVLLECIAFCMMLSRWVLPWTSIYLFHQSHIEAYNATDVKVTYALLSCTAMLETYSTMLVAMGTLNFELNLLLGRSSVARDLIKKYRRIIARDTGRSVSVTREAKHIGLYLGLEEMWPEMVAQYSLAGYFVRNKKHSINMGIVSFFQCKDFLDQQWCMEPCFSSARITSLVRQYLEDGWYNKIKDAATYRSFNNHNSHWGLNMNRPFDERVLLWHLATDFCFFSTSFLDHRCASAADPTLMPALWLLTTSRLLQCRQQESVECKAVHCRQMSNYMVYLLFVNPEMLLPGSRRNLFKTAYNELKGILEDGGCWSWCTPCGVKQIKEEAIVMRKLIEVMTEKRASQEGSSEAIVRDIVITVTHEKSESSSQEELSMEGSNRDKKIIDQAWDLAQKLLKMDEMKRWEEIQDVWVQMLCFSASRCRGYLHAKALGKGGEFLSYVWLLLFYMGMETFSERLQRELFPRSQADKGTFTDPPPTLVVSTSAGTSPAYEVQTRAGAGTTLSTSEICKAEDNMC